MIDFLRLSNISKSFGGVQALKDADFSIGKGEIHCLVGENGSGKSTLIKIISGNLQPDTGEIWIEGQIYKHLRSIDSINMGIQVIFQDFALFPNLTVAENIAYSQLVEKKEKILNWKEIESIARLATDKIKIKLDLDEQVGNLSVANQQMVAICRALTSDLRFLILDEPTSALTKKEIDQLFVVVKDLQQKGISVMFVSHKLNEILEIAERVTVIRDGQNVATLPREEITNEKLIYLMTGKEISYSRNQKSIQTQKKLLEVQNLSKSNNFKDISFVLHYGEIFGITGLLGSGRTELALALFGMDPADSGKIFVDGKEVRIRSVKDAIQAGIGYVPENRLEQGLIMKKSVSENIVTVIIKRLLGNFNLIDSKKWDTTVDSWINELGIKVANPEVPVQTLSGGNQQRVVIAKWLSVQPKILILDSPTVGIDIAAKSSIHSIIREMANKGFGIIFISDEISEVVNNCNRIAIMRNGRIFKQIDAADVTEAEIQRLVEMSETVSVSK
ncbi:MAG: sugar ABC transporter ATP-binding protein [Atribacterota bacterium]|jgi:simple sugar transport system ATP-binding protein|uniref:Xylose import ATP-binding protein XylG n=2 Tax=Atribacter TaxID=2847777 RepID=A0A1V5SKG8_9BACT|nr:sugar ABC transporter ATP-binding protein [Atribacterota bacterium]MDI9595543.1 sugar ABC transporter ATP-binding protein [Atribacterota bacterium]OQA54723.1 MAG: Xylose import ATP-binding protein XylG [Candidatus Atribacteria bacterium ADurb.Bin276]HHT10737.1 sugar ABC transporter ATP-binding protein [Candidatus Atribacteria bacterium]